MKNKLVTKWIRALRSGEYNQGNGSLYYPKSNSYCCLGVADKVCFGAIFTASQSAMTNAAADDQGQVSSLGVERQEKLGLHLPITDEEATKLTLTYDLDPPNLTTRENVLIAFNDTLAFDFDEIAAAIETLGWDEEVA